MKLGKYFRTLSDLTYRGVGHAAFALTHLMPRRKDLWAFGSWQGKRFADNARYLFLYCARASETPRPRCVWISASKRIVRELREGGLTAHYRWSLKGIWTALRAGVYVFDFRSSDISYALSGGAMRVNLWHGVPLKRIERDIDDPQHPHNKARYGSLPARVIYSWVDPQIYERQDLIVATGPDPARFFQSAFAMKPEGVLVTGYPRNDALFRDAWTQTASNAIDRTIVRQLRRDREAGRKIVGYFPTWRDVTMVTGRWYEVPLPVAELERVLAQHDAKLYCKLHQSSRAILEGADGCAHIEMLPAQVDIYQQLPLMDVLITDYSSVYFDYLLLDRPIVFYAPDLEDYQRYRTFYYQYDQATPGPKAFSAEELVSVLGDVLGEYDRAVSAWADDRERVRQLVHSFTDGSSSARCMQEIRGRLANGTLSTGGTEHP